MHKSQVKNLKIEEIKELANQVSSFEWQRKGKWVDSLCLLQDIVQAGSEKTFLAHYGYATGFDYVWFTDDGELMLTEQELQAVKNYFLKRVKQKGQTFFSEYKDKNLQDVKELFNFCKELKKKKDDLSKMNSKALRELFKKFVDVTIQVMSSGYTMFAMQEILEENLLSELAKSFEKIKPNIDFASVVASLTPPRGQSFVAKEEVGF